MTTLHTYSMYTRLVSVVSVVSKKIRKIAFVVGSRLHRLMAADQLMAMWKMARNLLRLTREMGGIPLARRTVIAGPSQQVTRTVLK
jgi:phage terminase small subunit